MWSSPGVISQQSKGKPASQVALAHEHIPCARNDQCKQQGRASYHGELGFVCVSSQAEQAVQARGW